MMRLLFHVVVFSLLRMAYNAFIYPSLEEELIGGMSIDKISPTKEGTRSYESNKDDVMQSWGLPAQHDITSIRILVANGCSGSTVTHKFMKEILTAHGYKIKNTRNELMKPHKNRYFEQAKKKVMELGAEPSYERVIMEAIALIHQDALSRGEILFFNSGTVRFLKTFASMKKIGMRFGHMYRWNSLDRCVCVVRDCFEARYGFPVYDNNGTKTDLCFQRRKSKEKIKAVFRQGEAESCVEKEAYKVKDSIEKIGSHVESSGNRSVTNEDLYAFEHTSDETTFNVSLRAWVSLAGSMMAEQEVNEMIISDILRLEQNTRSPPKPHMEVIYNIYDVEEELGREKSLQQFLREA